MISKIYFENKQVLLTNDLLEVTSSIHQPDTIFIDEVSVRAINSLLHEIATPAFIKGILFNDDYKKLESAFYRHFQVIQAAGGVVKNESGEILFIFRKGKWDLPKGKKDDNENARDCALREVKEETGLISVKAGKLICITRHTYKEFGKHILKETHWFEMEASLQQELIPQLEEGIEKIEWVSNLKIKEKLNHSYTLITDVLVYYGIKL